MRCAESLRVQAYFDGELHALSAADIERHGGFCAECGGLLEELERESIEISVFARSDVMRALTDQVKPLFGPAVTGITGGTPPATFARIRDASEAGCPRPIHPVSPFGVLLPDHRAQFLQPSFIFSVRSLRVVEDAAGPRIAL